MLRCIVDAVECRLFSGFRKFPPWPFCRYSPPPWAFYTLHPSIFAHSGAMFCYHSPRVYHSNFSGASNFRLQKLVGKVEDKSLHPTSQFSQKQSRIESSFEFSVLLCLSTCPSQHDHDISQTLHSPTVPSYASVFRLQEICGTIARIHIRQSFCKRH